MGSFRWGLILALHGACGEPVARSSTEPDEPGSTGAEPDASTEPPRFVEVAASAGLNAKQRDPVEPAACFLADVWDPDDPGSPCEYERSTGGVAVGDYDNDGWPDLFVTRFDAPAILYRNLGDGTFEDVTAEANLGHDARSNGAAWADIDNDGDLDLAVTSGGSRPFLYLNRSDGTFVERGEERGWAAAGGRTLGTSVGFGDYDGDGYVDALLGQWRGDFMDGTNPVGVRLLRNLGADRPGFFEDRAASAGLEFPPGIFAGTWIFASSFVDLDGDGKLDLAVASDFGTSRLFWNEGDGTFLDGTALAGVGTDEYGMGSSLGDVDGDGTLDWFVSSISPPVEECEAAGVCTDYGTGNRLYTQLETRRFEDAAPRLGVEFGLWGWGSVFVDHDLDSDLDLFMVGGMQGNEHPPQFRSVEPRAWVNDGTGHMTERARNLGLEGPIQGRALVSLDYDRDGDLDLLAVNNGGTPRLWNNQTGQGRAWAVVEPRTSSGGPAWGARVELELASGQTLVRVIGADAAFLGHGELCAYFGLGDDPSEQIEGEVVWPDGTRRSFVVEPRTRLKIQP